MPEGASESRNGRVAIDLSFTAEILDILPVVDLSRIGRFNLPRTSHNRSMKIIHES